MVYRGHVRNGRIELDSGAALPEGASVVVNVTDPKVPPPSENTPTLFERLRDVIGIVDDLPEDFAENHDHYIHGCPKR